MQRVPPQEYRNALPLIQEGEIRTHLSCVFTLVEGRQDGQIFVDDPEHPRTVLVCPNSGFWFLFGDPANDGFRQFLPELVVEHLVDKCAVFATSAAWRQALDQLLGPSISRTGFEFRPDPAPHDA